MGEGREEKGGKWGGGRGRGEVADLDLHTSMWVHLDAWPS